MQYEIEVIAEWEQESVEGQFDDKKTIASIKGQITRGNVWAWCTVGVKVTFGPFEASDYLGCCNYRNEKDFRQDGYFEDMVSTCKDTIREQVEKFMAEFNREDLAR